MSTVQGLDALLSEIESLTPQRIASLAEEFVRAEASVVRSSTRALARHAALSPDTENAIDVLSAQLAVSETILAVAALYGLDDETAYSARAAVLDMALVMSVHSLSPSASEALAGPWVVSR